MNNHVTRKTKKNIDLFIGVLPGGTMYCDKSRIENGGYKKLAFVSNRGAITNYVPIRELDAQTYASIANESIRKVDDFISTYRSMEAAEAVYKLLDEVPYRIFKECFLIDGMEKRLDYLLDYLMGN